MPNPPKSTRPCQLREYPWGAIRSKVNDGPVTTYKAGESFSELPSDRNCVSANASEMQPANLLAVFVVDTNETELTIPFAN
jgi:quercetin dioxygenase-like cupin family protein